MLRVLDRAAVNLDIESLGFPKYLYDYVTEAIQRPNGIFIVTGPTGCGKTTTLYSCLRRVNTIDSKLLTAEDPVEYDIEGIMQVAINEAVGHDLRQGAALVPAPGPGHHHGGGNARPGDGADFHPGVADRPPGA